MTIVPKSRILMNQAGETAGLLRFWPVFMRVGLFALFMVSGVCVAEDAKLKEFEDQLKRVREDLSQAEKAASESNETLWRYKDRVVYSNDTVKAVYLEIKNLEKAIVDKKDQLENELMNLEAYREMLKSRKDAYEKVRKMKDEEAHVSQLIKNRQWIKSDSSEAKPPASKTN